MRPLSDVAGGALGMGTRSRFSEAKELTSSPNRELNDQERKIRRRT